MKALLSKFEGAWHVTVLGGKPSRKAEFTSTMVKNSTMSDSIGLAVLIGCLLVLSQSTRIEYGNRNDHNI